VVPLKKLVKEEATALAKDETLVKDEVVIEVVKEEVVIEVEKEEEVATEEDIAEVKEEEETVKEATERKEAKEVAEKTVDLEETRGSMIENLEVEQEEERNVVEEDPETGVKLVMKLMLLLNPQKMLMKKERRSNLRKVKKAMLQKKLK